MLPAGWHRSFQILATCIWARTWDVRSYTWVWSVAMAGVENWQHGMLHRALNKLYSCSFWQGSKLFVKNLNLLLGYTGMGLVDFKGGFKFASEVTHVPVNFFGTGRSVPSQRRPMGDCEMKSFWGSWEFLGKLKFPNRIIRYVTRRSVRQENLKIRPNIVEN